MVERPHIPARVPVADRDGGQRPDRAERRLGFTLIEILLVVGLIGIALGAAMPTFVSSIRSHRLNTAARSMVTAARYARSMAVLNQQPLALTIQIGAGVVAVAGAAPTATDAIDDETPDAEGSAHVELDDDGKRRAGSAPIALKRKLDRIAIAEVTLGGDTLTEGTATIPYYPNGQCRPFAARLLDRGSGAYVVVHVDALSSVRTERGEEP